MRGRALAHRSSARAGHPTIRTLIRCASVGSSSGESAPATHPVADLYKTVYSANVVIQQTDARTAELVKYMENCFLATKVAFCNEFYDIAERLGVDYNEVRELWLLNPRMGRGHTGVHPEARGFGGACLPKDVAATLHIAEHAGVDATVLQAVARYNKRITRTV